MSINIPIEQKQRVAAGKLPVVVWATGWVSFLTDLSTELIYGILPAFSDNVDPPPGNAQGRLIHRSTEAGDQVVVGQHP